MVDRLRIILPFDFRVSTSTLQAYKSALQSTGVATARLRAGVKTIQETGWIQGRLEGWIATATIYLARDEKQFNIVKPA